MTQGVQKQAHTDGGDKPTESDLRQQAIESIRPGRDPEGHGANPRVGPRVTLGMLLGVVIGAAIIALLVGVLVHPLAGFAVVAVGMLMLIFNPAMLAALLRTKSDETST